MTDLILPLLKILGLILTAFFSLTEFFRTKGEGDTDAEKTKRRRGITAILVSLVVAVTAETVDAVFKLRAATDAAERAADAAEKTQRIIGDLDRSLHPLFPVKVTPVFQANLAIGEPLFAPYLQRLLTAAPKNSEEPAPELSFGSPLFPNPVLDAAAYALLTADAQATVFLFRHPTSASPLEHGEPDLSFPLRSTYPLARPVPAELLRPVGGAIEDGRRRTRTFRYGKSGVVFIQLPKETISASDCYSNGEIVSSADLLGAKLVVRLSPFFTLRLTGDHAGKAVHDALELHQFDIELPGFREIQLGVAVRLDRTTFRDDYLFSYQFPSTKLEMEKLFVP